MPPWLAEPLAALGTMAQGLEPLLAAWWPALPPFLLALLFLALWLRARARPTDPELRAQLRAARNEIRLLKGDLIHARRTHAAELQKISKELEAVAAAAGAGEIERRKGWRG